MRSIIAVDMLDNFGNYFYNCIYFVCGKIKLTKWLLAISIRPISTFTPKAKFFFHRKRSPMSLMRFIRLTLHSPKVRTRTEEDRRLADRRIVSRLSHGNIRLQRGEYVTREEIEEQYERVKSFNFDGE